MKRVLLFSLALLFQGACDDSKVASSGTGGNSGSGGNDGGPAVFDGGDDVVSDDTDDSVDQAEQDAIDDTGDAPATEDVLADGVDGGPDDAEVTVDMAIDAADGGSDVTDGSTDRETATIEACPDNPPMIILCSGYCSDVTASCPDQFADFDACVTVCSAPTWSCGSPGATTGNTLWCRITHGMAAAASSSAAATECPQAGPNSTSCH
jgi:hypothetical protein